MTVKELIEALQLLPADFRVAGSAGGRWYEINAIAFVDPSGRKRDQRRASVETPADCVVELQP